MALKTYKPTTPSQNAPKAVDTAATSEPAPRVAVESSNVAVAATAAAVAGHFVDVRNFR